MNIKLTKYITTVFILFLSFNLSAGEGSLEKGPVSGDLTSGIKAEGRGSETADQKKPQALEKQNIINLTLKDAVTLALRNDETLEMSRQEIKAARADVLSAKAQRLPHLEVSGQYGRNINKPAFFLPEAFQKAMNAPARVEMGEDNDFACAASLTLNLWTAGRVSAAIGASSEVAEVYEYQQVAVEKLTKYRVREAYYNVLLAEKNLRIAEKALCQTKEAARIARVGNLEGTVSRFDRMRAETELANRKAPLTYQRNNLRQKIIALKRECGIEYSSKINLTDSLSTTGNIPGIDYLLGVMRDKSPEIKALMHKVSAGKQNLSLRKAERWPILQFGANYAVQSQWSEDFLPESNHIARSSALTLGFSIPIFDGLKTKGEIKKARAELRVSEIDLERALKDKESAVRNARLGFESAIRSLEGCKEAVKLSEEAHRIALVRLKNGMGTSLERLDSELAMTKARAQLAEALYSCNLAKAVLELSVGADIPESSSNMDKEETINE